MRKIQSAIGPPRNYGRTSKTTALNEQIRMNAEEMERREMENSREAEEFRRREVHKHEFVGCICSCDIEKITFKSHFCSIKVEALGGSASRRSQCNPESVEATSWVLGQVCHANSNKRNLRMYLETPRRSRRLLGMTRTLSILLLNKSFCVLEGLN